MQNEIVKLLRCDIFALLPIKFIFTNFVKRFNTKTFASNQVYFVIFRIENMLGGLLPA